MVAMAVTGGGAVASQPATAAAASVAPPTVMIVMDTSGSMNDDDGTGRVKLVGAKMAVQTLVNAVDPATRIGLRTYPDASQGDCNSGRSVFDIAQVNPTTMNAQVRGLTAGNGTPTGDALRAAADDLQAELALNGGTGVLVLVSDGESNCDTKPCEVAAQIRSEGLDIVVNTIGFRISEVGREELTCVAQTTGGRYVDVKDSDELVDEIGAATTAALTLKLRYPTTVDSVSGSVIAGRVEISAEVDSVGQQDASNVVLRLRFDVQDSPALIDPVRRVGNLATGTSVTVTWTFATPADFRDRSIDFTIEAESDTSVRTERTGSIGLRGKVRPEDAGPLLSGKSNVVILGDSYSSGEGSGDYLAGTDVKKNRCHRSNNTYGAALFAQRTNLACSGATTQEYWNPFKKNEGEKSQRAQLVALPKRPDLVMVSFGGNDIGFEDVISKCLVGEVTFGGDCNDLNTVRLEPCRGNGEVAMAGFGLAAIPIIPIPAGFCQIEGPTLKEEVSASIANLPSSLVTLYRDLDRVVNGSSPTWGPGAAKGGPVVPIVVMPYPLLAPDTRAPARGFDGNPLSGCPEFSTREWQFFVELTYQLNESIASAVKTLQAEGRPVYVADAVASAFQPDHTLCAAEPFANFRDWLDIADGKTDEIWQWIFSHHLPDDASARVYREAFHPNALGYQAETAALATWSRREDVVAQPYTADPVDPNALQVVSPVGTWPVPGDGSLLQGERGSAYRLQLDGFDAGTQVRVRVESSPVFLGVFDVDAGGVVQLPASLAHGRHHLVVTGLVSGTPTQYRIPVQVDEPRPWWVRWWWVIGAAALTLALLLAAVARFSGRPQRRPQVLA